MIYFDRIEVVNILSVHSGKHVRSLKKMIFNTMRQCHLFTCLRLSKIVFSKVVEKSVKVTSGFSEGELFLQVISRK